MILGNYIHNPSRDGKRKTKYSITKEEYLDRFNKIESKITMRTYKSDDGYYFHAVIPSEQDKYKTKYDVVIKVFPNSESHPTDVTTWDYQLFCNSPSFTYFYAYVYNKYDMIIPEFIDHYNTKVFTDAPKRNNPDEEINHEKTIFYAITYIISRRTLSNVNYLKGASANLSVKYLQTIVKSDKEIMDDLERDAKKHGPSEDNKIIDTIKHGINKISGMVGVKGRSKIGTNKNIKTIQSKSKSNINKIKKR